MYSAYRIGICPNGNSISKTEKIEITSIQRTNLNANTSKEATGTVPKAMKQYGAIPKYFKQVKKARNTTKSEAPISRLGNSVDFPKYDVNKSRSDLNAFKSKRDYNVNSGSSHDHKAKSANGYVIPVNCLKSDIETISKRFRK